MIRVCNNRHVKFEIAIKHDVRDGGEEDKGSGDPGADREPDRLREGLRTAAFRQDAVCIYSAINGCLAIGTPPRSRVSGKAPNILKTGTAPSLPSPACHRWIGHRTRCGGKQPTPDHQ